METRFGGIAQMTVDEMRMPGARVSDSYVMHIKQDVVECLKSMAMALACNHVQPNNQANRRPNG